ncbi:MAG: FecR domain-containing protein [Candidatus Eremiobacteraeota bacterium]|nr:FecR domain-containing protein [Candidatus Eremiobacteraeota bacterium]
MSNHTIRRVLGGMLATALGFAGVLAAAQPAVAQYATSGAPGVADVSVVQGDVVIVRGDSGAQVGATLNAPLLPGDYISTAGGSRAEVQLDGISMLRLAEDTQVRFVNLNPGSREMQLAAGTAELAELQGADGNPQIDTPSVTVRADQTGDYRVSVLSNGQTLVTVRSGTATVYTGNGSQKLTPGTTLVAYGDYNAPSISLQGAVAFDAFDQFNVDRDQAIVSAYNSNPYLSPALAGYTNFAGYGQWYNVPGYGESWAPSNQNAGWAPYSNGQWVWEPGYGYTWVGNEPWGYVPYHYGSWFYSTGYNQWMWQPPAYQYQNPNALASAWLPAMVAFFLTGGNPGAFAGYNPLNPYGYGEIGWVPLAPGEQYVPWYSGFGASAFPQTGISPVTNVTNVYNVYRNIRYIRVVRVIRIDRFRDRDFSHPTVLSAQTLRHVAFVRGAVPIEPTKALLAPARAKTTVALSPRFHEAAFAAKTPGIVKMASFDRQTAALHEAVAHAPAVVKLPVRTTAISHPVYRAPAVHETFHAPVQVTHRAAPAKAVPQHEVAPQREVTPQHEVAPQHVTAPEHATTQEFTAPKRVTAPEHSVAPEQRFVPQTRPAATARPAAPERPAAMPERTVVPERTFAPERTVAPQRTVTPVREAPRFEPSRVPATPAIERPARTQQPRPQATPVAQPHTAPPRAAPPRAEQHATAAPEHKHQNETTPPPN